MEIMKILKDNIVLFSLLVSFNILNVLDKSLTYLALNNGFIETNTRIVYWIKSIGLFPTMAMQVLVVGIFSILIFYLTIKTLPKIKQVLSVPLGYLNLNYLLAVISNVRWII